MTFSHLIRPLPSHFNDFKNFMGLVNLCVRSQITLKLVISRTMAVLTDLNRHRNLIRQLYIFDQAIVDPFQWSLKFQPYWGCRKPLFVQLNYPKIGNSLNTGCTETDLNGTWTSLFMLGRTTSDPFQWFLIFPPPPEGEGVPIFLFHFCFLFWGEGDEDGMRR